jgi:hypothetical protein
MVNIGRVEGRAAVALHSRGVGGQHADPRLGRRPVRTSPLLCSACAVEPSFSNLVRGRVSSHAEARQHKQLSKRARPLRPSLVLGWKDSSRASARVCAMCRENSRCAAAIVPSWNSVPQHKLNTRAEKSAPASGPLSIALWVVAAAARWAALPLSGLVQDRPRTPWPRGRVICAVPGPSTVCTAASACVHRQPRGRWDTRHCRLPCSRSQQC